jgi:hypothetical protein
VGIYGLINVNKWNGEGFTKKKMKKRRKFHPFSLKGFWP